MDAFDTQRLRLRPLAGDDEALYCRLYADPVLMLHVAEPLSLEAARRSFRAACAQSCNLARRPSWWSIADRQSGVSIGVLGLQHDGDAAEIGAMLLGEWQGRGLAVEAITKLIDVAFARPGLHRLWIRHAQTHARGAGVAYKLGFEREETVPDEREVRWHLRREDWTLRRGGAYDFATSEVDR